MDIWLTTEHKEIWSIHLDSSFLRISGCVFRAGSWWHWMCTCEQSPGMPAKVTVFLCSNHVSIHGYKKHVNKLMDIHMIDSTVTWKSLSRVWLFVTHGLFSPWNSPGQNTGVGSLSLLQMIFPTQGSIPGFPHAGRFFTSWATREVQEYWSGKPFPSPGDLPNLGIESGSTALPVNSLLDELLGKPKVEVSHV